MRFSLLNFVDCPVTHTELACVVFEEVGAHLAHVRLSPFSRVSQGGALVGPVPPLAGSAPLHDALRSEACDPAPPERNQEVVVKEGMLVSGATGRWYPIRNFVPEMLPDHLRDWSRDAAWLDTVRPRLPGAILEHLAPAEAPDRPIDDGGLRFKKSEMGIGAKVEEGFFGPGLIAPFNPHARHHSMSLIQLLGLALFLVDPEASVDSVLDAGSGYSWTTEWMWRLGIEAIGCDITRDYLDIGLRRLGPQAPHLVVGDTENLPLKAAALGAVLCFDAFHHVPDRRKGMAEFERVLRPGGPVVLAEPDGEHEHAEGSQQVMEKYGILEKGMELADVRGYVEGLGFDAPEEHLHLRIERSDLEGRVLPPLMTQKAVESYSTVPWNVFRIRKPAAAGGGSR